MGNRLSKIVTRTGDGGTTGLGDGSRVGKDSPRIDTLGEIDELNSSIGVLLAESLPTECAEIRETLLAVQHHLFDLGGEICIPGYTRITDTIDLKNIPEEVQNAKIVHVAATILPAYTKRVKVLADLRKPLTGDKERDILFGKSQYAKR